MDMLVWHHVYAGRTNMYKLVSLWNLWRNPAAKEFWANPDTCTYSLKEYLLRDLFPWRRK